MTEGKIYAAHRSSGAIAMWLKSEPSVHRWWKSIGICRVHSYLIVIHKDISKYKTLHLLHCRPLNSKPIDKFLFKRSEKTFHFGIVVTMCYTTQAVGDAKRV